MMHGLAAINLHTGMDLTANFLAFPSIIPDNTNSLSKYIRNYSTYVRYVPTYIGHVKLI